MAQLPVRQFNLDDILTPQSAPAGGGVQQLPGAPATTRQPVQANQANQAQQPAGQAPPAPVDFNLDDVLLPKGPTSMEMLGAAAESGGREAVGGLGFMGGARMGAAFPVPIYAKPFTALAGGILGYLAGNSGVDIFEDISGVQARSPEEFPQELQPAAYGGATLGGSMGGAGGLMAIAKSGVRAGSDRMVGRLLNKVLDTAATRPGMFLTAEGTAAGSAALAEAASEYYFPDYDAIRVASGIGAGAVNPVAYGMKGALKLPELMQNFLGKTAEISSRVRGTPEDLKKAASLRHAETRKFFDELIGHAEGKAAGLVRKMRTVDDKTILAAEYNTNKLLDEAYSTGRRVETVLGARAMQGAYGEKQLAANNVLQTFETLLKDRFMGSPQLPQDIESFLRMTDAELRENIKNISPETVGFIGHLREMMPASGFKVAKASDLIKLRTRALNNMRALAKTGDLGNREEAEALGKIAESALNDLSLLPSENFGALKEYTEFSHLFNERFSKPFLTETARRAMAGEMRIPPELIGTKLITQGNIQSAQHYQDLRDAIGLSLKAPASMKTVEGVLDAPAVNQRWDALMQAHQDILKNAAARTINPETGKVDAASLALFRRENGSLLKRFPELSSLLRNAQKAQRSFENINKHVNTTKQGMNLLNDIVGSDDPVMAIGPEIMGKNYRKAMSQLSKTVLQAGGDAPEGLFSTVIHATLKHSTNKDGMVSVQQLKQALDGRNNLLTELQRNGIIDDNRTKTIRKFLDKMVEQEKSRLNRSSTIAGMMGDFVNRLSGINAATRIAEMVAIPGGGKLAVASMGSRLGQKILGSVPDAQTADMLAEVLRSPEQMENMLRTTQTTSEKMKQFALLHGYLLQEGLSQIGAQVPEMPPMTPAAPRP